MTHAKTDSDVTSMDTSSSPKRAVYYVQSPSRDSHDGDKSSSPMDSPSRHSYGHHSRASSSSRVSGSDNNASWGRKGTTRKGNEKGWPECKVIEEEEGYYGEREGLSRRTQIFVGVVGFVLIFGVFCLIIAGAARPYKVRLGVKSLTVHNFYFGEGSDMTGVPTKMLTVNCSVRMTVHNPATFFGIHVSSKAVNLMYSEIAVATGELKKHYQPRKSTRTVSVNLEGSKVPLYGAGASLTGLVDNGKIPMTLVFEVKSQGNVVGKLVRSKHRRHVSCSVAIDSHNNQPIKLKENACTYN
ncbi:Late embryogenesis abundant protein, LEA-14 [Spatholobus suberectus]|nr:Late embryogenesis abundant protein, LEA-14 [Spatholobus suberectus]